MTPPVATSSLQALRAWGQRVDGAMAPAQRELRRQREAERLAIEPEAWSALLAANIDAVLLREVHRAVIGKRAMVRRADADGQWSLAAARPGHLRSQAQSFRVDEVVGPAWDHATLKRRLGELIEATRAAFDADPVGQAAQLVWTLVRAQPFAGDNERVALVMVSRLMRAASLPAVHLLELERDPVQARALIEALAASTPEVLAHELEAAIWSEAVATAEWLPLAPPKTGTWTLRDEHVALEAARAQEHELAPGVLEACMREVADELVPQVETACGAPLRVRAVAPADDHAVRLRVVHAALGRGRVLCPQRPLIERRWSVDGGPLELVLVAGAAGRGLTGAHVVHAALELPGVPLARPSPALLVIPDESDTDRAQRLAAWAPAATTRMLRDSPLRC